MDSDTKIDYLVVGGGIAGVTCVETLALVDEDSSILLVSASALIKTVTNFTQVTRVGETFDVEEKPLDRAWDEGSKVKVMHSAVTSLNADEKKLFTADGKAIKYEKLCICTGGKPKVIAKNNSYVVGIRDTESVQEFQKKVKKSRRIVIIGNGGIATELVYELEGCEVVWAIKDKSIAHTFVDAGAGEFLTEHLHKDKDKTPQGPSKRLKYTTEEMTSETQTQGQKLMGGALGPDWVSDLVIHGASKNRFVKVEYNVEVKNLLSREEFQQVGLEESLPFSESTESSTGTSWPVYVQLTNHKVYGCDLLVSATGVVPFTDSFLPGNNFELAEDGGFKVNDKMETSVQDVFAAGDVCTACWEHSPHWLQMRLWSQARQMGCYAAKSMAASRKNEDISMDFCFELFAHITTFFRFKVVLLGKFNAQGLGEDYEILLRVSKGEEYVKAILHNNRLVGAVLIGETDLEETFENLILNAMDLTPFKDNLLEPGIDVEDFFD